MNDEPKPETTEQEPEPERRISQFKLREIVMRCFHEALDAGFITNAFENEGLTSCIINIPAVAAHISKTAIGELTEFEIVRKLQPVVRSVRSILDDCDFMDREEERDAKLHAGMRIKND